jgi:subtilisin family serine protease
VAELGLRAIGVDKVWRRGFRGEGIVVAVTDTGVDAKHPALKDAFRGATDGADYSWFDAVEGEAEPIDEAGHGSHVAGIVAGEFGARQIGAAPEAKWIACRLIKDRSGPDSDSLRCLQWVLAPTKVDGTDPRPEMAPDIVNASWGGEPGEGCRSGYFRGAVRNVVAAGILFVASAGNSGSDCDTVCAPGSFPEALTVGNYDAQARRIHDSSSRGPVDGPEGELIKPDIAAPGTNINSSVPGSRYDQKTGTSMAAPHIAGVAALLLSARPELRGQPEALREAIVASGSPQRPDRCGPAGDNAFNNSAGRGLVDADEAVEIALSATPRPTNTATLPPSPTPTPSRTPTQTATPPPSDTPTEGPSPTSSPTRARPTTDPDGGGRVFLPALLDSFALGRR